MTASDAAHSLPIAQPVRVMLVDDHPVMRAGVATLLGVEPDLVVVAEADDGISAVRLAKELTPDVIVMDDLAAAAGRGRSHQADFGGPTNGSHFGALGARRDRVCTHLARRGRRRLRVEA